MNKKVAFVGHMDYANIMTEYSKAINKYCDGFESKVICTQPHPIDFVTKHDYDLVTDPKSVSKAKEWLINSTHIIVGEEMGLNAFSSKDCLNFSPNNSLITINFIFSQILKLDIVKDTLAGQKGNLHLYHTGSIYRNNYISFNLIGSKYFNKIIHGNDLYRLAWFDLPVDLQKTLGIHETYNPQNNLAIYTSYDFSYKKEEIKSLIDRKFDTNKITIFHATTRKETKGTDIIVPIVQEVVNILNQENAGTQYEFITPDTYEPLRKAKNSEGWVPNDKIMETKKMSHFYVDEYNSQVGYFGGSSVEALLTGNITLATINNFTPEAQKAAHKNIPEVECPVIHLGSSQEEFKQILLKTLRKPKEELKQLAYQGLEWYFQTSDHKAVATKFKKEVLI